MDHSADAHRTDLMTITRYTLNEQSKRPESRGDFTILLNHIVLGCKFVCSAVNKAGLAKLIGLAGEINVQGEEQKKLDVLSNEVFVKALVSSGRTCILVSEEDEEAIIVEPSKRGRYCVVFDPLDGSSNIDCGVSIGTIFGIYMLKDGGEPTLDNVLQPGKNMVAAGYCMYGSSCTLVLSTGSGVNGFTLDPSLGEFILTHPDIKIPKKGKIYSVNEGNAKNWDAPTSKYVEKCKFPQDGSSPKSLRYIGSMVADVHRTLLYGGIFLYPADKKSPNGKLRVLYEVFPMSFLMEQAGGQSFTRKQRDRDRKLRIFTGDEHPFHDRPLEPYVMPPRQVREMRPRDSVYNLCNLGHKVKNVCNLTVYWGIKGDRQLSFEDFFFLKRKASFRGDVFWESWRAKTYFLE